MKPRCGFNSIVNVVIIRPDVSELFCLSDVVRIFFRKSFPSFWQVHSRFTSILASNSYWDSCSNEKLS